VTHLVALIRAQQQPIDLDLLPEWPAPSRRTAPMYLTKAHAPWSAPGPHHNKEDQHQDS
jgi:hypothetical protein